MSRLSDERRSPRIRPSPRAARVFGALGDETRLRIVDRLSTGEALSIVELTQKSKLTRQAITKHLAVLARARVVRSARRGRERLWTLDPRALEEAQRSLAAIGHRWESALERLRAFVED